MVTKRVPHAKCPKCRGKQTRLIPRVAGESPALRHWVCDTCKIGWYDAIGAPHPANTKVDIELAKRAYAPQEGKSGNAKR